MNGEDEIEQALKLAKAISELNKGDEFGSGLVAVDISRVFVLLHQVFEAALRYRNDYMCSCYLHGGHDADCPRELAKRELFKIVESVSSRRFNVSRDE